MKLKAYVAEVPDEFRAMLMENPERLLSGFYDVAGLPSDRPLTFPEAIAVVNAFGYDCEPLDVPLIVSESELWDADILNGELRWSYENVADLILALDDKRRWLIGFHESRKTPQELLEEKKALAEGRVIGNWIVSRRPMTEIKARKVAADEEPMRSALVSAFGEQGH